MAWIQFFRKHLLPIFATKDSGGISERDLMLEFMNLASGPPHAVKYRSIAGMAASVPPRFIESQGMEYSNAF
jgi:hypothetical protein